MKKAIAEDGIPQSAFGSRQLKSLGFSDKRLAQLAGKKEADITDLRLQHKVTPVFKRIDTCAAEFSSSTAYLYSSYENTAGSVCEARPSDREKVVILGGGVEPHWSGY